ncbi:cation-translocating P-type ATPase [Salsuginibacillus kocurii]|uniref:cation-translocating P-type ATPase n=1 Tax=Salsuginibacillus kocurii TaxID=427078 RepID=UPI00036020E0|nr:cation-translocating P-type ATPase [Salsuginibacillus kocurii]
MNWHNYSTDECLQHFHTDEQSGLSSQEAKYRLQQVGLNELSSEKKRSSLLIFLEQFKDFMVLVLLAATLLSGLLGEYVDAITIMIIVFLNGVLGFMQERKAERSIETLKAWTAPQMTVKRNGAWVEIPAKTVVPGDIVKLQAGDRIGADLRLLSAHELLVEESALSGESQPVDKNTGVVWDRANALAENTNMGYAGTTVLRGTGEGVVVATGMQTEMGKIAHLLDNTVATMTPLQRRLEHLGKVLVVGALALTCLVVWTGVMQGHDVYTMLFAGVSLAVAAIPEGLPAIVTVALALGVQRMIKHKAIVRRLPAVETLGCATIICSDKTGTLTKNEMTVTKLWSWERSWDVEYNKGMAFYTEQAKKVSAKEDNLLQQILLYGAMGEQLEGTNPTEQAMVNAAKQAGITSSAHLLASKSFDSERKRSTIIYQTNNNEKYAVLRGAPDVLAERAAAIQAAGRILPFTAERQLIWNQAIQQMGKAALRPLAVGYKKINGPIAEVDWDEVEQGITLVGMQGMIDPPREDAVEAIRECRRAGVKTVMITGDHHVTAEAIASQLELLPEHGKVLTGRDLDRFSPKELEREVQDTYVYARVTPEHKLKIVQALKRNGHIVAMTGDGVNDAPALKAANIGVAMGKTGTDVAKEAASLILSDDHFSTIKQAIKEGRNIYDNIRKFIRYMLASNVGEILVMLFAMLMGLPLPLVAIQILWINLVTDGLPAMALGLDKPERDVMNRPPRPANESIFARKLGWKVISRGFLIAIVTLIAFVTSFMLFPDDLTRAQTIAFATLIMAQLIHVFDCRSETNITSRNPFGNVYLLGAVASSVLLMLVVIYFEPLQGIFHTTALPLTEWLLIVPLAALPTLLFAIPRRNSKV